MLQVLLFLAASTLCTLSVNLSVSVVLQWRHARLSLMALCSTCGLTGQGSTAPEADSHKQKLCVYRHQVTTSLSPVAGGVETEGGRERKIRRKEKQQTLMFETIY